MIRKLGWLVAGTLALAACDEGKKAPEAAKETAQPAASGDTKPAGAEDEKAEPKAEETKKGIVDGLPGQVAGKLKLPAETEKLAGGMGLDLFSLQVPKGMSWTQSRHPTIAGQPKKWRALSGDAGSMALYDHNPSGDDGPNCPTVEEMKKKVEGAETLHDLSFSTETVDNVSYGDEVKLWMFEKDGKVGFYGRKLFDHGDDATTWCAAPGKPGEAEKLATRVDKEQAETLAAIFMSLQFAF